jgi:hypothetical protein
MIVRTTKLGPKMKTACNQDKRLGSWIEVLDFGVTAGAPPRTEILPDPAARVATRFVSVP